MLTGERLKNSLLFLILYSFNCFAEGQVCMSTNIANDFIHDTGEDEKIEKMTCLESYNESAKSNEQQYRAKICENGKFELDIDIHFNEESVKSVFENYFLSGEKLMNSNNLISSLPVFTIKNQKKNKISLAEANQQKYTLTTAVKKYLTSEIQTNCKVNISNNSTTQTCTINTESGGGKKFDTRYKNQTKISFLQKLLYLS